MNHSEIFISFIIAYYVFYLDPGNSWQKYYFSNAISHLCMSLPPCTDFTLFSVVAKINTTIKVLHMDVYYFLDAWTNLRNDLSSVTAQDILTLTESWLNAHVPAEIACYTLFICDRKGKGGRVLIYVNNWIIACLLNSSSVPN